MPISTEPSTGANKYPRYSLNHQHSSPEGELRSADLPHVPAKTGISRRPTDFDNIHQHTSVSAVNGSAAAFADVAGAPTTSPRVEDCRQTARELPHERRRFVYQVHPLQPQQQPMSEQKQLLHSPGRIVRQRPNQQRGLRHPISDEKPKWDSRTLNERRQMRPSDVPGNENMPWYFQQDHLKVRQDRRHHEQLINQQQQPGQTSSGYRKRYQEKLQRQTKVTADQQELMEQRPVTERCEDAERRRFEEMARVRREIVLERRRQAIIETQVNARQKMRQSRRQLIEAQRRQAVAAEQRRWQQLQQAELARRQNWKEEAFVYTNL